jgi:lysophospholipase L1-like esterase
LLATRFQTFGDSITRGEVSLNLQLRAVEPSSAYPEQLRQMLAARYSAQTFIVTNDGVSGETARDGASRLTGTLRAEQPDVLLLLEGVNDLSLGGPSAVQPTLAILHGMIKDAQARGATVMVGTLLPQKRSGFRATAIDLVPPFNGDLRRIVVADGAVLVDLYNALLPDVATLIGEDGLHPTREGYVRIAGLFLDAIKATFESAPTTTSVVRVQARPKIAAAIR